MRRKIQTKLGRGKGLGSFGGFGSLRRLGRPGNLRNPRSLGSLRNPRNLGSLGSFSPGIISILGLVGLVWMVAMAPVIENSRDAFAEGVTQDGISISLSANSLTLESKNADGNGFTSSTITSSVTSSNAGGYNLYMSAGGKDQNDNYTASLVNTSDKQYTIGTLPSSGDGSSIDVSFTTADGVRTYASTSNFTTNKWAYSVQDITGKTDEELATLSGTSTFKAIPLDTDVITVAKDASASAATTISRETRAGTTSPRTSSIYANNSASGAGNDGTTPDQVEITIATRTDNATPAGDYGNTIVFTAIANASPYKIIYDRNGESGDGTSTGTDGTTTVGGDMSMVSHANVNTGSSIVLYAPNYWRAGYGFLGWSVIPNSAAYIPVAQAATEGITTSNTTKAIIYGPNETVSVTSDILSHEDGNTGEVKLYAIWKASEGNMQSWSGCSSMSIGDVTALTDTRDGNTYAVAKLADGKCWESENLRLSSGTVESTATNNPASGFSLGSSSNNWCTDQSATCYDKALLNTNNINSSLTASPSANNTASSWYGYGVYYDWYAATAGNGKYETASGNTSGDICPLGWHLPAGSSDTAEFTVMINAAGNSSAAARKFPYNFILPGRWIGDRVEYRGSNGDYYSATAYDNSVAYYQYFDSSNTYLSHGYGKHRGRVVRCIADSIYSINYDANGGSGTMTNTHTGVKTNDTVNLIAPNFSRTGYGFLGWSFDTNAGTDGNTSTIYGPNESITAPNSYGKSTMTLYAIWKASEGDMQSWTGCSSMNVGDVTALNDTRDNNVYAVAKLGDNKCWQIENLRLSSGAIDFTNTYNPVAGFSLGSSNTGAWCATSSSECDNQSVWNNANAAEYYAYGNYYNWFAATAGNGKYETNYGDGISGDICPLGWHLPSGTLGGEFKYMYDAAGDTTYVTIRKFPFNFVYSGYWYGENLASYRGRRAMYWSRTALSNDNAFTMFFHPSYATASNNDAKHTGASVRCIADTPTASAGTIVYNSNGGSGDMSMVTHTGISNNANVQLYAPNYWRSGYGFLGWSTDPQAESKIGTASAATIYGPQETITAPSDIATNGIVLYAIWKKSEGNMQDWKGCSSMSIGDVTALTDTRDNNVYAVAKLADNKCWQSENLRLSSGTVDATNTNNPVSGFTWTESSNSWCMENSSACDDKVTLNTNNISSSLAASPTANNNSSSWYGYGTMYNWYTATAGRGTYSMASGNTTGDICPTGWHLPTSFLSGEYRELYTALSDTATKLRMYPNNFVLSGWWYDYARSRGSLGLYWSSTAGGNNYADRLYLSNSHVGWSDGSDYKYRGYAVRCIAG